MLAETVSLTDEEILVIMLVLIGLAVAVVATAVLGCVWAWRAGRGSQLALGLWMMVATLEALAVVSGLPGAFANGGSIWPAGPVGALAVQVGLYLTARKRADAAP